MKSLLIFMGFFDTLGLLGDEELDMAIGGEVGGDSTMGSVGSSSALDCSLHSDVGDHALLHVQALGLRVRLKILQELENVSCGLVGPSSLGLSEDFGLGGASDAAGVLSEGDTLLVLDDILDISNGFLELQSFEGSASFKGVFEMSS